jgi:hypothetical protein
VEQHRGNLTPGLTCPGSDFAHLVLRDFSARIQSRIAPLKPVQLLA